MWFAARDIAFEHPVSDDMTQMMLERMGIAPGREAADARGGAPQRGSDAAVPRSRSPFEMMLRRMIGLVLIEVSAFHTFAWAEAVLSDRDLVAGDGEAATLVRYIRADETPHVEYLRTALTEMRDRTFVGESGRRIPGTDVIGELVGRGARPVARSRTARTSCRPRPRGRARARGPSRGEPRSSRASTRCGRRRGVSRMKFGHLLRAPAAAAVARPTPSTT